MFPVYTDIRILIGLKKKNNTYSQILKNTNTILGPCHLKCKEEQTATQHVSMESTKRKVFHQNLEGKWTSKLFLCAVSLCLRQGHKAHFLCNWTNSSLCNDWPFCPSSCTVTKRAMRSLHILAVVTWHHVPLYCDVAIECEEMKCLRDMWLVLLCEC